MIVGQPARQPYSLITVGTELPEAVAARGEPYYEARRTSEMRLLQATYFAFAFGVPIVHLACLLVLWAAPLTPRAQRRLFVGCEVCNAWAALDVFVLAVFVSLTEISPFAAFIIGDKCDAIDALLKQLAAAAPAVFDLDGDYKCFDVAVTLNGGTWALCGACVVFTVANFAMMRACHVAIHDRADARAPSADAPPRSAAAQCCSRLRERTIRALLAARILVLKPVLAEGGEEDSEPCAMI